MALRTALVQLQSEQRARAHQFALVQRDRDALLQKRRDEEKREAEDRRREGRQMQLEDNIQRLRKRRLPRRHASSSSSSSVHSTLSDGSINKNCYKEIEKEVIECVERKIVFHQPVGVLNKVSSLFLYCLPSTRFKLARVAPFGRLKGAGIESCRGGKR